MSDYTHPRFRTFKPEPIVPKVPLRWLIFKWALIGFLVVASLCISVVK